MNVSALKEVYWISPDGVDLTQIKQKLNLGILQIQLRRSQNYSADFIQKIQQLCADFGAIMLVNTNNITNKIYNKHLHLNSNMLMQLKKRPNSSKYLLSASAHNKEQLVKAEKIKADFATISPILATKSHPDATPLGWQQTKELIKSTKLPIYCLGGMTLEHLTKAKSIGAVGIAGISLAS